MDQPMDNTVSAPNIFDAFFTGVEPTGTVTQNMPRVNDMSRNITITRSLYERAMDVFQYALLMYGGQIDQANATGLDMREVQAVRSELFKTLKTTGWTPLHTAVIGVTAEFGVKTYGRVK